MAEQMYTYTNESFSGCDMVATILLPKADSEGKTVYTLGELQTISYSIHMDRQPVRSIGNINVKDYVMGPRTIAGSLVFAVFNKHFANKMMKEIGDSLNTGYSFLIDEIPPFDIVISMANEYGLRSRMVIYGVRLVNEGQVMSINDVYTENTYQFVATDLEYLTDENTYTSESKNGRGMYKIIEQDIDSYGNRPKFNYKDSIKTPHFDIKLNYKINSIATKDKQGIVSLWLTPTIKEGYIKITGEKIAKNIIVKESIGGNNRILVQLPAGEYSAIWINDDQKSNTVTFRIKEDVFIEETTMPAPVIEFVGDTSIHIHSNVREHTKVIYEDSLGQTFSMKLTNKRAKLTGLTGSSRYKIATCDENANRISDYAEVTTLSYGYDKYKDFLDYLSYNKKSLKNSVFSVYVTVVMDAKQLAFSGANYQSITDSLIDIGRYYEEKISNLDSTNFPGIIEYQEELDRLQGLYNAAIEITYISTIINSDSIYGYNYNIMVVNPPIPETYNNCTNSFLVDNTIKCLDFFKENTNTQQFAKTIEKRNFREIDETTYSCVFNGKPGSRYSTYATNIYGFRSPKIEFYCMKDSHRAEAIENQSDEKANINYQLDRAMALNSHKIDPNLGENEIKRVLTEIIKVPEEKLIATPRIDEVKNTSISVSIDEVEDLMMDNSLMATICELDFALTNKTKYKIPAQNIMTFSVYDHGLKPNKTYAIWIEDSEENQISEIVTVVSGQVDEISYSKEYDVNKYFIKEIIDKLRDEFIEQELMSSSLDLILYKHENDIENNKSNVLDKILEDIISESLNLNNMFDILYSFFKVYLTSLYSINKSFFDESIILQKNDKNIKISKECYMTKINIGQSQINKSTVKVNNGEIIPVFDEDCQYSVMFFVDNNIGKRSGFMLSSNLSDKYITYEMQVKVGE